MVRAGALPAARVAVRSVNALIDIAVGAGPETGDALEVIAKGRRRAVDILPATEVIAPRVRWRATCALDWWWFGNR